MAYGVAFGSRGVWTYVGLLLHSVGVHWLLCGVVMSSLCRCQMVFMQVPLGLYSGAVWSLYRCCVVVWQVPHGIYSDAMWSLFRCCVVVLRMPRGILLLFRWRMHSLYSSAVWFWFRCCVVVTQVPSGAYADAAWPLFRCRVVSLCKRCVVCMQVPRGFMRVMCASFRFTRKHPRCWLYSRCHHQALNGLHGFVFGCTLLFRCLRVTAN